MRLVVPLTPEPQTFAITLNQRPLRLRVLFNDRAGLWTLDIADNTGATILGGLPLITGADLLEQHGHLGLGGRLFIHAPDDLPPDGNTLGTEKRLVFEILNAEGGA